MTKEESAALASRRNRCTANVRAAPGGGRRLRRLHRARQGAGVKLAVATAAPTENIDFTLDGLDLRKQFDAIAGAADVARGKPQPDVFLLAAQRSGALPEHSIVFEDAPLGVEAARRAGMRAVVLTTTLPAEAFAEFDNVIAVVRDLRAGCRRAVRRRHQLIITSTKEQTMTTDLQEQAAAPDENKIIAERRAKLAAIREQGVAFERLPPQHKAADLQRSTARSRAKSWKPSRSPWCWPAA
jgi:beta-phosphoglucomutase-like phosphatase (HAD superfamily)